MVWDIFDEIRRMQEELDRTFNEFFSRPQYPLVGPGRTGSGIEPVQRRPGMRKAFVDVQETEESVIITAELPGMDKEDIEVNVTTERIEITAQKKEESQEEKEGYKSYGRRYAGFFRSVPLPSMVKADDAKATYKNGVLEITLPKIKVTKSRNLPIE